MAWQRQRWSSMNRRPTGFYWSGSSPATEAAPDGKWYNQTPVEPVAPPASIPTATGGGGTPTPTTGGGEPIQGVRADQDLFNRLFGEPQEGGGYVADQVIANTMQNRAILPAPVNYTQTGLSPNIQRRMDLMTASNPVDALRNPPAGPAMARDNGQAIARNTPGQPQGLLTPWTGPGPNPMHTGKMPRGRVVNNGKQKVNTSSKMPSTQAPSTQAPLRQPAHIPISYYFVNRGGQ